MIAVHFPLSDLLRHSPPASFDLPCSTRLLNHKFRIQRIIFLFITTHPQNQRRKHKIQLVTKKAIKQHKDSNYTNSTVKLNRDSCLASCGKIPSQTWRKSQEFASCYAPFQAVFISTEEKNFFGKFCLSIENKNCHDKFQSSFILTLFQFPCLAQISKVVISLIQVLIGMVHMNWQVCPLCMTITQSWEVWQTFIPESGNSLVYALRQPSFSLPHPQPLPRSSRD